MREWGMSVSEEEDGCWEATAGDLSHAWSYV